MTKQQTDIIKYHKQHPAKSRKAIAEAFGIRIYFVNKAFDRYKIENEAKQTSMFGDKKTKQKRIGDRPESWRMIYEFHKTINPYVYSIPAKLFWQEMENTRWREKDEVSMNFKYIINWKLSYIKWLRMQARYRKYDVKGWAMQGKII